MLSERRTTDDAFDSCAPAPLHRPATAIFLFLAGITGSILAFHHELDEWLNPEFYHTTSEGPVLSPGTLVERVEQANPRMQVWYMEFPSEPGHAALMALVPRDDPATGKPMTNDPWCITSMR